MFSSCHATLFSFHTSYEGTQESKSISLNNFQVLSSNNPHVLHTFIFLYAHKTIKKLYLPKDENFFFSSFVHRWMQALIASPQETYSFLHLSVGKVINGNVNLKIGFCNQRGVDNLFIKTS